MKRTGAVLVLSLAILCASAAACGGGSKTSKGSGGETSSSAQQSSSSVTAGSSSHASSGASSSGRLPSSSSASAATSSTSGSGSGGASSSGSGAGGSSGTGGGDAGAIDPNAFYVATNGDDHNPGTFALPFATLAQAQTAMQMSSTTKTVYIRAGTYKAPMTGGNCVWGNSAGSSISLSSADQGETWSYYPPDGYASAILDGQSTAGNSGGTGGNGVGCAFGAGQVSGITIVGLQMQNYLYAGVWAYAATNLVVSDNEIHDATSADFSTGAVYLASCPNATVARNYVHDVAYMGIVMSDGSMTGDQMSGDTASQNVVINACTWPAVSGGGNDENGGDCGGIYLWSKVPTVSTNLLVENNLVRDVNVSSTGAGDFGSCCAQGIYLDDGTNGALVRGNVVTGMKSACFQIHGGENNVFEQNVCDLGAGGSEVIVMYQNDSFTQMTGNVFEGNIVVAGSQGAGMGFLGSNSPPNPMTIKDNLYWNYVGAKVGSASTSGAGSDSNPTSADPGISCWAPVLQPGGPASKAPVSFPGIPGGWGWPGFVVPKTGTAPSWPHGC